jgi:hypothetical protein
MGAVCGIPSQAARQQGSTTKNPGGAPMASPAGKSGDTERIPFMQRVLDNPFLLLFLGVTFPAVLYMIWGIMEIIQIPIAK